MVSLDAFAERDVYLDLPYKSARFRHERSTGRVYRRFYGEPEQEIPSSSPLYHDAIAAGREISREEYFRD